MLATHSTHQQMAPWQIEDFNRRRQMCQTFVVRKRIAMEHDVSEWLSRIFFYWCRFFNASAQLAGHIWSHYRWPRNPQTSACTSIKLVGLLFIEISWSVSLTPFIVFFLLFWWINRANHLRVCSMRENRFRANYWLIKINCACTWVSCFVYTRPRHTKNQKKGPENSIYISFFIFRSISSSTARMIFS